ncbi:MAG: serine/threonine protein kinase [Deltaproteobacteria bacterium]|nr:serine/threonine protein kinase [Deltaproteobacteria bacterium]
MSEALEVPGYRLVRPLGAGGMGSVYVAERLATHQLYAVKFLREDHLDNESSVARFHREIKALRSIRHPHVVGVFDAFAPQPGRPGRPWVVMELLEGEGLDRLLRRRRSVSPSLAVSIMLQVLDGLAAVHARGIVHRDLGPSNIFLVPQQHGKYLAKVLDFGLSRVAGGEEEERANITQRGTLMGKPAYVAPEMFHHRPLDARADLYACGVLLFRMIAGRLPYRELRAAELWGERYEERTQPQERPKLGSFVPGLPEQLEQCVAKALRLDPRERYASAEKMQVDLIEIEQHVLPPLPEPLPVVRPLSEGPAAASTADAVPTPRTIPPRSLPRGRLYVGAAAIVAVAAAALVLALTWGEAGPRGTGTPVEPAAVAVVDGGGAVPDVVPKPTPDAGTETAESAAEPAATQPEAGLLAGPTVHIAFEEVPDGATVTVDGIAVDPAVGIDLPQADRRVDVVVVPERAGLRPYRVSLSTREDRVIRPRFSRVGPRPPRDAGPTVIHGQQGTTFVLELGGDR